MSNKKGFSGLEDLGANIDNIIRNDDTHNTRNKESFKEQNQASDNSKEVDEIDQLKTRNGTTSNPINNNNKNSNGWILWLAVIIALMLILIQTNNNSDSSSYQTTKTSYQESNGSNSYEPENAPTSKSDISDYFENKPEPYIDVLNKNQLLYCEAEKIRLDIVQDKIDLYSSSEVDKFNTLTHDYNDRCANKQYYEKDRAYVDRNILNKKNSIQNEGLQRFNKIKSKKSHDTANAIETNDARNGHLKSKDMSSLTYEEKSSAEIACSNAYINGPEQYNKCLKKQIAMLKTTAPDMSSLTYEEKSSAEIACSNAYINGPEQYNKCLKKQLKNLGR